jgi:hypothetical protein
MQDQGLNYKWRAISGVEIGELGAKLKKIESLMVN